MIGLGITRHNDVKGEFELSTMGKYLSHRDLRDRNAHQEYMDRITPLTSLFMVVHINLNLYYL